MAANTFFRSAYKYHCGLTIDELRDLAHTDLNKLHGYEKHVLRTRKKIAIHVLQNVKKL